MGTFQARATNKLALSEARIECGLWSEILVPQRYRVLGQCGEEELAPGFEIILGNQMEQGLMARASLVQRHRKRVC
jgi:hypothetical protein